MRRAILLTDAEVQHVRAALVTCLESEGRRVLLAKLDSAARAEIVVTLTVAEARELNHAAGEALYDDPTTLRTSLFGGSDARMRAAQRGSEKLTDAIYEAGGYR